MRKTRREKFSYPTTSVYRRTQRGLRSFCEWSKTSKFSKAPQHPHVTWRTHATDPPNQLLNSKLFLSLISLSDNSVGCHGVVFQLCDGNKDMTLKGDILATTRGIAILFTLLVLYFYWVERCFTFLTTLLKNFPFFIKRKREKNLII